MSQRLNSRALSAHRFTDGLLHDGLHGRFHFRNLNPPSHYRQPLGIGSISLQPHGVSEAAYAASAIMSSTVRCSTVGFISALLIPARAPSLKSNSCRTR